MAVMDVVDVGRFIFTATTALAAIIANQRQHRLLLGAMLKKASTLYVGAATYEEFLEGD